MKKGQKMANKARKCTNCDKNSKCKMQQYYTDKKTKILTCPSFK